MSPIARQFTRALLPVLVLALGGATFLLLARGRHPAGAPPAPEPVRTVAVRTVEPAPRAPVLTLYGHVNAPRLARLRAAVSADVIEVAVAEGERVTTGALLARLDQAELAVALAQRRAEVAEAEAALASERLQAKAERRALERERALTALAEAEVRRVRGMMARGLASDAELDRARTELLTRRLAVERRETAVDDSANRIARLEARLAQARARLRQAELDLARTRIVSPYDGRVARVAVSPGDRVRPGDLIAEVYELASLEVRARVPGPHLGALRTALAEGRSLRAEAVVDDTVLPLRLERLAGRAPEDGAGLDALLRITAPERAPALGRFVLVRLWLAPVPGAVALPDEALYGADRIYKVVGGRLHGLRVRRIGRDAEGAVLVIGAGLAAGDRVLVTRLPDAVEGLRVRIIGG